MSAALPISQDVIDAAQASHKAFWPRGPFVSVSLAQFGLESAWGKYASGKNNYFGIKATPEQIAEGKATARYTHEDTPSGLVTIVAKFADYDSLQDCFDAHARLLVSSHYERCTNAANPFAYCQALHDCGYATDRNYAGSLTDIINDFGLLRFDQRF